MVTITEENSKDAGRCQGCEGPTSDGHSVYHLVYEIAVSRVYGIQSSIRLCRHCMASLRIAMKDASKEAGDW